MDVRKQIMYFKKHMHLRNILMHVRNICMHFQKHKTTKSGLQIFLVCVVWRYCVKEFANLRAFRDYVPYVPIHPMCLRAFVPQITTCLRAYVP